jgi:hypothetical protein
LIQGLEVDLDESCELMIERFRHEKGVDSLVSGGEFRGRGLDAGDGLVVGEGGVRCEVLARYPVSG